MPFPLSIFKGKDIVILSSLPNNFRNDYMASRIWKVKPAHLQIFPSLNGSLHLRYPIVQVQVQNDKEKLAKAKCFKGAYTMGNASAYTGLMVMDVKPLIWKMF